MIVDIKNSLILRHLLRTIIHSTCQRWSTFVPIFVYMTLFLLVKYISLPLRSSTITLEIKAPNNQHQTIKRESRHLRLLEDIFYKADIDENSHLSVNEIATWITLKTNEHINEAVKNNLFIFESIDVSPNDGVISWKEYHNYFLKKRGLSELDWKHDHKLLSKPIREAIIKDKAAWSENAKNDPDLLTVDEFLTFMHPESSYSTILSLVDDLLEKFDRDGDELLTEEEFVGLQDDVENARLVRERTAVQTERRQEFRTMLDTNKDGKASRQELFTYVDPKNPRFGQEEAETLMLFADENHDSQLSLSEILNKMDLFLGSKMVNIANSFHDEF